MVRVVGVRDDRDPTDLGLPSEVECEVIELRTRRRTRSGASSTIGPASPPVARPSEQVRAHVDAIYAQQGWTRPRLPEDEERNRTVRCRRVSCRAEPGEACVNLVGGVRRRPRAVSHPERAADAAAPCQ